jgi:hypothetical protein
MALLLIDVPLGQNGRRWLVGHRELVPTPMH